MKTEKYEKVQKAKTRAEKYEKAQNVGKQAKRRRAKVASEGETKRTLRQDIALICRGYKTIYEICPANMIWRTASCVMQQLWPYVALYMSALLINEIAAGAGWRRLLTLALLTVGLQLVLNIGFHLLRRKEEEMESLNWNLNELYFLKVQCQMQFKHFDDPETAQLRHQIRHHSNYGGHGLNKLYWCYREVLAGAINLVLSVSLTASMLKMSANGEFDGFLAFVNSPISSVMLLLLIGIQVVAQLVNVHYFEPRSTELFGDFNKRFARMNWYMNWNADGKIFHSEKLCLSTARDVLVKDDYLRETQKNSIQKGVIEQILVTLMNVALFLYVGAKAYIGVFGIGSFVLYRGTVAKFTEAVSDLGAVWGRMRQNNVYLEEVYRFLDLPDEMYHGTLAVEKRDDYRFEIEFRNVSFKYPGSDKFALKNLSFKFRIGERLAFVGMNGSGKTTFVKLLCRLYDPTEGEILLNGIDIKKYKYEEYMQLFSVVFQDYYMFAFSLGENVSAKLNYDEKRVEECLKKAGFGERLAGLERGLDTPIGREYSNDGIEVSGGEAQKIALARALYKNAPFIILDEPTAALDPLAEAEVYSSFNEIVEERTAIYISHRLSSCRFCDNIVVFHEGELVQYGNHEELILDMGGKYYELWNAQAKYYTK